ncbi:MAG: hypothetical protein BMS9Abin07_2046 [Acidimicrobiia bacterium]|nr:MAG: hypothetical protein BMS9Abin07_2046 [Acidimicrobiia bacterium]
MARRSESSALPGNDGRWFLELLGLIEPEMEPTAAFATLESLVPPPVADDTETANAGAVSAAVNGALLVEAPPNGELVSLTSDGSHRRRVWWITSLLLLILGGAIGAGIYLLPRAADQEATELASQHRTAMVEMRNELPKTQQALADLTDPAASPEAVSVVPEAIAALSSVSGRAIAAATAPLPTTLPLVPRDGFDSLKPTREAMTILGATGRDIAGRIGVGFSYRSSIEALFAIDGLPVDAPDDAITGLSLVLAEDLADSGRIVADLPQDAGFIAVAEAATVASQRYPTWQLEYLDALRQRDRGRAETLLAELEAARRTIESRLHTALIDMRTELDGMIVVLAAELETAIDNVP